jgi:hypothetical protein
MALEPAIKRSVGAAFDRADICVGLVPHGRIHRAYIIWAAVYLPSIVVGTHSGTRQLGWRWPLISWARYHDLPGPNVRRPSRRSFGTTIRSRGSFGDAATLQPVRVSKAVVGKHPLRRLE